ncbi:MAG TPA: hypothetical protein DD400_00265 [Rhodospirillaceae bacterium]|nr:hypothetical protein [Rhodospirillaceae bacterium]
MAFFPLKTCSLERPRRSKVRVRVEHIFGRQHAMGGKLMRSIGINRAKANIGIKNLVYNLQRHVFLAKPAAKSFRVLGF